MFIFISEFSFSLVSLSYHLISFDCWIVALYTSYTLSSMFLSHSRCFKAEKTYVTYAKTVCCVLMQENKCCFQCRVFDSFSVCAWDFLMFTFQTARTCMKCCLVHPVSPFKRWTLETLSVAAHMLSSAITWKSWWWWREVSIINEIN